MIDCGRAGNARKFTDSKFFGVVKAMIYSVGSLSMV